MDEELILLDKIQKDVLKRQRLCMFQNCNNKAIKSHVLQKNGILNKIACNGHLVERKSSNWFKLLDDGIVTFQKVGLSSAYTFNGFCQHHDSSIFKPIEVEQQLDLYCNLQQSLFCYRGLCQEIRRKEISVEIVSESLTTENPFYYIHMYSLKKGLVEGIENLKFFKSKLEYSISNMIFDQFYFETVKIPRIELCISAPLNIYDKNNSRSNCSITPYVTSFVNVFPKDENSYVIVGYHKDYPCYWTDQFISKIKATNNKQLIFKEISDLVSVRLEFWLMSEKLFNTFDSKKLNQLKDIFSDSILNFSKDLNTNFNLFDDL